MFIPFESMDDWAVKSPLPQEELVSRALMSDPEGAAAASNENAKLASELQALKTQRTVRQVQIDELKSINRQTQLDNQELNRAIGTLEATVSDLDQRLAVANRQLDAIRIEQRETKRELSASELALSEALSVPTDRLGFVLNPDGERICKRIQLTQPTYSEGSTACDNGVCMSSGGGFWAGSSRIDCYMSNGAWAPPPDL